MRAWHLEPESCPHPVGRAHANSRAEGHVGEDTDGRRRAGLAKAHEPARARKGNMGPATAAAFACSTPTQTKTHLRALCGAVTPSARSRASRAWPVRVTAAHSASNRSSCLAHVVAEGEKLHNPYGGCCQSAGSQRRSEHVVVWCGLGSSGEPWLQLENYRAWWLHILHSTWLLAQQQEPTEGCSTASGCHDQASRFGPATLGCHLVSGPTGRVVVCTCYQPGTARCTEGLASDHRCFKSESAAGVARAIMALRR